MLRHAGRSRMSVWGLVAGLSLYATSGSSAVASAAAVAAANPSDGLVGGVWQHQKLTFQYVGFTALYTCEGLESHVRQILLHLGARKDAKVSAVGCPGPGNAPSNTAGVYLDFYTLAPVADAAASDTIKARWTTLELTPQRPSFMGDGDCELVQAMKDVITKNFTLRDVEYRTSCFPHTLTMDGFAVKGQALRALPAG